MAKKGETRLQRKIQRALKREFHVFVFKVWGSMFQQAGIPDLVGCCAGLFFGIEVKMPKGRVSEIQKEVMRDIHKRGGGYVTVATTPEEACDFIRRILRQEGKLLEGSKAAAKARSRLLRRTTRLGIAVQAKAGEDIHRRRRH